MLFLVKLEIRITI